MDPSIKKTRTRKSASVFVDARTVHSTGEMLYKRRQMISSNHHLYPLSCIRVYCVRNWSTTPVLSVNLAR